MDPIVAIITLLVAIYPVYLVWRFLTLGIKAFKKILRTDHYYVIDITDSPDD